MDSVPVGRYIPSGCVSRADVQCLVILGSSACGLGIRATPAEEMFLFHVSYVRRGMDRPKTGAWVDDRGPEPSGSVCYLYGIADYHPMVSTPVIHKVSFIFNSDKYEKVLYSYIPVFRGGRMFRVA